MNILITGGNGLLGVEVLKELEKKYRLYVITKNISSNYVSEKLTYIKADLSKKLDESLLPKEMDVIVHLAQSPNYKLFPEKASDVFQINCVSTQNLLDYALKAKVKQFIYTSSGSVYEPYSGQLSENKSVIPSSFYANTKLIGERLCFSYERYFNVCALRLFFLYGPHFQEKKTLINNLYQKVLMQEYISVDGKYGLEFVPTLTYDVARCISGLISKNIKGIFNFANSKSITIFDAVNVIGQEVNIAPKIQFNEDNKPQRIIPNLNKIHEIMPDFIFTKFEDGIKLLNKTTEEEFSL